jgi:hypothetical protein
MPNPRKSARSRTRVRCQDQRFIVHLRWRSDLSSSRLRASMRPCFLPSSHPACRPARPRTAKRFSLAQETTVVTFAQRSLRQPPMQLLALPMAGRSRKLRPASSGCHGRRSWHKATVVTRRAVSTSTRPSSLSVLPKLGPHRPKRNTLTSVSRSLASALGPAHLRRTLCRRADH